MKNLLGMIFKRLFGISYFTIRKREKILKDPEKAISSTYFGKLSIFFIILSLITSIGFPFIALYLIKLGFSYLGVFTLILGIGNILLITLALMLIVYPIIFAVDAIRFAIEQRTLNKRKIGNVALILSIIFLIIVIFLCALSFIYFGTNFIATL